MYVYIHITASPWKGQVVLHSEAVCPLGKDLAPGAFGGRQFGSLAGQQLGALASPVKGGCGPHPAAGARTVFTQWPQCPQRTRLSVTQQTAGSRGAVSWALLTGSSRDVSASPTKMLPSTPSPPPLPGGVLTRELGSDRWLFSKSSFRENIPPR